MTLIDDAAQAPATETVVPDAPQDIDAAMDTVWEEHNAEPAPQEAEKAPAEAEAVEAGQDTPEPDASAPEAAEMPTFLPASLKGHWGAIPADARDLVAKAHQDMSAKLGQQGREMQAIAPIKEALSEAVQNLPMLSDMSPAQAAREITQLAEIGQRMNSDPVNTIWQLVQDNGVAQQIGSLLQGQVPQDAGANRVQQQLAALQRKLDAQASPEAFDTFMVERDTQTAVTEFAESADHWSEVEEHIPSFIQIARGQTGEGASPVDVLKAAHQMAIRALGLKASAESVSPQDTPQVDPDQVAKVARAKAVNLAGTTSGKGRVKTQDELLDEAYDRASRA